MSPIHGGRIKELRTDLGLSQRALAERAGVRQALVSQLENDAATQAVSVEQLERLATALGVAPAKLLTRGKGKRR